MITEVKSTNNDGINGKVVQARINKSLWNILGNDAPPNSTSDDFAVKISRPGRKREAELEKDFLQALKKRNVEHKHLAVCYFCFECAGSLYFVMDLAKGNLDDFMKTYPHGSQVKMTSWMLGIDTAWLLEQMHGLAGALDAIHRPSRDSIGWHHDIKPQNILYYGDEDDFRVKEVHFDFRITDWTTAKIRPRPSGQLKQSTKGQRFGSSEVGWPAYLPAETLEGPTACEPDIWSLGCVFLELLIWFNKGYNALDSENSLDLGFRQLRHTMSKTMRSDLEAKLDGPEHASDADYNVFYRPEGDLKKYVEMAIDSLDAKEEIRRTDVRGLVRQMLMADPKDRPSAHVVCEELSKALNRIKKPSNS